MRKNALLLLAVGCLVALAGCSGALTGGTDNEMTYPDGVSENGTNVSKLTQSHDAVLNGSSFTLRLNTTTNTSMGNQSLALDAKVGQNRDQVLVNVSGGGRNVTSYQTAEKRYTRLSMGGQTVYRADDRTPQGQQFVTGSYSGSMYVDQFAQNANFTPNGTTQFNGETVVVLEADGSNVSDPQSANLTDYEATMLVDEQGVVRKFDATVRTEANGAYNRVSLTMTISNVNETSVPEPNWLDEARNQSNSDA
ncbi:DUF7537 family lipoprotein [Halorussus halophilus]|uniref:DUF7537 family lipoprotein n=1 Tax=Halorussus halophilus TaxID=2650975 RepID=UPI0013012D10|nr:hypothetical protein [Halorussus halophilus]